MGLQHAAWIGVHSCAHAHAPPHLGLASAATAGWTRQREKGPGRANAWPQPTQSREKLNGT